MNILHFKKSVDKTIKNKYNSFKLKVVLDMKYFILFCLFFTAFSQATVDFPYTYTPPYMPPSVYFMDNKIYQESTPLHYWASDKAYVDEKDAVKNVKSLIDQRADVNTLDKKNNTPLHYANSNKEIVQILIDAGADVNAKGENDSTPLHYAKTKEVAQTLIDAGADVRARTYNYRRTPLSYAIDHGKTELVKTLRQAGGGNIFSRFFYRTISNCQAAFQ